MNLENLKLPIIWNEGSSIYRCNLLIWNEGSSVYRCNLLVFMSITLQNSYNRNICMIKHFN
jgi:hypothetical protein